MLLRPSPKQLSAMLLLLFLAGHEHTSLKKRFGLLYTPLYTYRERERERLGVVVVFHCSTL